MRGALWATTVTVTLSLQATGQRMGSVQGVGVGHVCAEGTVHGSIVSRSHRGTPGRRSDILSTPPMLAWPCKRQKTIDRLWFRGAKYYASDRRCYGFSIMMVPGSILLLYTHIEWRTIIPRTERRLRG